MTLVERKDTPVKKGYLAKAFCSNSYCPRVRQLAIAPGMTNRQVVALMTINKSEAICDKSGHYWCQQCKWRADVLDWGKLHNWPALSYSIYAVATGQMFWELAVKMGRDEYVEALADAISIAEEV